MNLKRALWIMMSATRIGVVFMLAGFLFYITAIKEIQNLWISMFCILIGGLLTLSKRIILKRMMNKMSYPGLLYGVSDKMGFLYNLGIYPGGEIMDDLYHPSYPTEAFLSDNKLSPDIYRISAKGRITKLLFTFIPVLIVVGLYLYDKELMKHPAMFVLYILVLLPVLAGENIGRVPDTTVDPIYRFTSEGLQTPSSLLAWGNVYDWEFVKGGKNEQNKIVISLKEPASGTKTIEMPLGGLATSLTDLSLLLLHYKNKYGYMPENE